MAQVPGGQELAQIEGPWEGALAELESEGTQSRGVDKDTCTSRQKPPDF